MNPFNISADINAPAHIPKTKFIVRTNTGQIHSYTNCDKNHHYAVADVRRHLLILVTNANRAFASCDGSLVMPLQGFSAILMETLLTFWGGLLAGLPTYPWKRPRRWTISHMALAYTAAPSSGGSQVDPSQILLLQVTNGQMNDSTLVLGCPLQSSRNLLATDTVCFSHMEQPSAFCLSGLVRSTERRKEKKARPPGWSTAHVLFATHCTNSVTQVAISLLRYSAHSLKMQAWKERNVCSRDIKGWISAPHLEPHLNQSSSAWCSIRYKQIHTVLALYWLFSCICCQKHRLIYWRERINIPGYVERDILKT